MLISFFKLVLAQLVLLEPLHQEEQPRLVQPAQQDALHAALRERP